MGVKYQALSGESTTQSFSMDRALLADVKALAKESGISASALVVAALEAHLEQARQEQALRQHSSSFREGFPPVTLEGWSTPPLYVGDTSRIAHGTIHFVHPVSGHVFVGIRKAVEQAAVRLLAEEALQHENGQPA